MAEAVVAAAVARDLSEVGEVMRRPGVDQAAGGTPGTLPVPTVASATSTAGSAASATAGGVTYTVEAGDTLFGIALQANVTLAALLSANNMQEDDFLQIGQVLVIPGRTAPLLALSTPAPALTTTRPLTATGATTRTTGAGSVAATGSVTTTRPATGTVSSLLPTATPRPVATISAGAATAAGPSVHTVAEGDTIITIALEYNLDWQELLALNGLGPDSILQLGQEIRLR